MTVAVVAGKSCWGVPLALWLATAYPPLDEIVYGPGVLDVNV